MPEGIRILGSQAERPALLGLQGVIKTAHQVANSRRAQRWIVAGRERHGWSRRVQTNTRRTNIGQTAGQAARYLRRHVAGRSAPGLAFFESCSSPSPPSHTPPQTTTTTPAPPTTHTMVRPAFRLAQPLRPRLQQRAHVRFASTNPSADAAQKKAQDAFASAQKVAGQVAEKGRKVLGPVGDKLANMFGGAYACRLCV